MGPIKTFQNNQALINTSKELIKIYCSLPKNHLLGCKTCELGKYCPDEGLQFSNFCPPGSFCPNLNSTDYTLCPAGKYQDMDGSRIGSHFVWKDNIVPCKYFLSCDFL